MRVVARCALAMMMTQALVGCGGTPSGPRPIRHVVLLSIDTLRADHLGAYGYAKPTSPALDALAKESTLFEVAVPTCPSTGPSVASIMTGAHRATHRVLANGWVIPDVVTTLAERLKAQGYETVARVANVGLEAKLGFAQGFDDYVIPERLERAGSSMLAGAPLVADVQQRLARRGEKPLFLWAHLMDPHGPYAAPPRYEAQFPAADYVWPNESAIPNGESNYGLLIVPKYQVVPGRPSVAAYRAAYDAEIRYTDDHVAAILGALRAQDILDETLLIVTADHGESLGEHRYYFQHGWYVYDDSLRVPLMVRAPGVFPAGHRHAGSVSLVDLVPTVLEILGIAGDATLEGASLRPLVEGAATDRPAFAQTPYGEGIVGLRLGRMKYVFRPGQPGGKRDATTPPASPHASEELYDLAADPGELHDLSAERPAELQALRNQTNAWLEDQKGRAAGKLAERSDATTRGAGKLTGDPQIEKQLRALGYID